jgi:PAS domain S-box-containing protein
LGFWRFTDGEALGGLAPLVPEYQHAVGWLAGLLAVFAGCALFPALVRARASRAAGSRRAWLCGGAAIMSIGFWGTQNVALLGFGLPAWYWYDPVIGFAALLPAALGCGAALAALARPAPGPARLQTGALCLALGVGLMHYTLMEAIRGDVLFVYSEWIAAESVLFAYGFALAALLVDAPAGSGLLAWARRLAGSALLGLAVVANHFVAMSGTIFFDDPAVVSSNVATVPPFMLPFITACVLFLVAAYWLGSIIDGRLGEAGAAVRSSEARNRAVVETMLDAHITTDSRGIVRSFNPAAEHIFRWRPGEIVGQPVDLLMNELNPPKTRDWQKRGAQAAAASTAKKRWVYPAGGRRKDGSTFPVELAISPFQVDGEQFFSCAVRDLSGRWEGEARLRRLAAAIEQAGDGIAILDAQFRIQYVNPQYERQTGRSSDEVVGHRPTGGISDESVYADLRAAIAQGRSWTGQVRSRHPDGGVREEELTVTPVTDAGGALSGYVAVMRDVTRRLEGELERRRLAEALQHCADAIEILDSQGRIVYVNAAFEARSGQRLADIRGSRPEALADFGPAAGSYDDMVRTAYRGGRPWSGALKSVGHDGEIIEEDVTVSPMRDDGGHITGYVVVKRDTADRRRLEAQERQRQKLESIGQMADGIAQELNAPMRDLGDHLRFLRDSIGHLDRLLADLVDLSQSPAPIRPAALAGVLQSADVEFLRREIALALRHAAEGVGRMDGIVHAMRDISRSSPEKVDLDLNRAIHSTVTVTRNEWKTVAEVRVDLDEALPPVRCAPGEIGLVVMNMLVSCAQAAAAATRNGIRGKGVITVATRARSGCAEIRIGLAGRTISAAERERLFDPAATDAPGMALAHDIVVRKHNGTLALDTDSGDDATFVLRLPLETSAPGAVGAPAIVAA